MLFVPLPKSKRNKAQKKYNKQTYWEEQLPAGVPDVAPLSDADFARFGERLRGAEER